MVRGGRLATDTCGPRIPPGLVVLRLLPDNTYKHCAGQRRLSGAQGQSVHAHLWRQASRSYVTVPLIFLKRTHRIKRAAPSSSADTPPLSAPTPTLKDRGACSLWFDCHGVFPRQTPAPAPCSGSPGPAVPGHPGPWCGGASRLREKGTVAPHAASLPAFSGSPETAWAGGHLGCTSRSTEVMMGADVSCVRAPGDSQWPQGGSSKEPSREDMVTPSLSPH